MPAFWCDFVSIFIFISSFFHHHLFYWWNTFNSQLGAIWYIGYISSSEESERERENLNFQGIHPFSPFIHQIFIKKLIGWIKEKCQNELYWMLMPVIDVLWKEKGSTCQKWIKWRGGEWNGLNEEASKHKTCTSN